MGPNSAERSAPPDNILRLTNIPGIEESHSNLSWCLFKRFNNKRICTPFIRLRIDIKTGVGKHDR
jgi:hypothetical protein